MFEFLNGLDPLLKGFWYVALFSSAIFIIQSIMTFVGGSDMDGIDADFDGNLDSVDAPFQLFSFRNLINFLLGFGWSGIVFYPSISNHSLLIAVATLVGLAFIAIFFVLIKQILKLSEDNTFQIESLVNLVGHVYIPIPGNMSGTGQIQVSVKGANHELSAMTEENEKLVSGTPVKVERIQNNILIVKKFN